VVEAGVHGLATICDVNSMYQLYTLTTMLVRTTCKQQKVLEWLAGLKESEDPLRIYQAEHDDAQVWYRDYS